jgi:AraC-like DNA-binding protein
VQSTATILLETQAQVRELLGSEAVHVEDVAAGLFLSKSTLQRRLAERGTSFTAIRRRVQVDVAIERLIAGASCASAARRVGLSRDHLCRLVSAQTALQPGQIARACQLARRAERWRRSAPPRAGTRVYSERNERWRRLEREVTALLAPVPASGDPLSRWACKLRRAAQRPDYRRGAYRARARAERRREQLLRGAELRSLQHWLSEVERAQLRRRAAAENERRELAARSWILAQDAQVQAQQTGRDS